MADEIGEMDSIEASAGDDPMAQLQRLGEMKRHGLLTDDEFRAAKAKLRGT